MHLARFSVSPGFIVTTLAYLTFSGLAWAASTPPGGVPDEPSHVVYSAAVVRGDLGEPTDLDHPIFKRLMGVEVPQWATTIVVCYAFQPAVTADCQPGISQQHQEVPATTTATKYPPPYYAAVGIPTLILTGAPAFYAMRVVSVAIGVLLIGVGLAVASPGRRWWLALGVMVAFTPTAAHLLGSVNPNGFEIASTLGLGAALLGLESEGRSRSRVWFQTAAVAVLGLAVAWARPWSILIMIGVVGLSLLANWVSLRAWARANPVPTMVLLALILIAGVAALLFEILVRAPASATVISELAGFDVPFDENLDTALDRSGSWMMAIVGQFGWLDHGPPSIVVFTWLAFLAAFVIWALAASRRGGRFLLMATVVGATIVAPLFAIEFLFGNVEGYQARYHLSAVVLVPLLTFFLLGSRVIQRPGSDETMIRSLKWFAALAPLMMVLSVLWSLARYSIGFPFGWTDMLTLRFLTDAVWLPPGEATLIAGISLVALLLLAPAIWHSARLEQRNWSQSPPARSEADESVGRGGGG